MQRARKLKRVSWAPASHLCQDKHAFFWIGEQMSVNHLLSLDCLDLTDYDALVKFFLSEDCPSKIGNKSQEKSKALSTWPLTTNEYGDSSRGFEGNHFQNQYSEFSEISQIKWECPPSFALSHCWCVAAGEESMEKYDQMLREMRVSEAYYPCTTAIPPGPFVSFNVENECYDDSLTPVIPQIHIQEYESVTDIKSDVCVRKHRDSPSNLETQAASSEANLVAASAAAVVAAISESNEKVTEIDMDFLLTIANDPIVIGKLIEEYSTVTTTGISTPLRTVSARQSTLTMSEIQSIPSLATTLDKPATPPVPLSGPVSALARSPTPHVHMPVKNQCKKLVRKHGGNSKQDMQNHNNFQDLKRPRVINPEEVKMKIEKPCKYYKTSRGCRNGSRCRYQHDMLVWRM
ncbi:unnamed protein product [Sphenostylis stenocarpa]|uniref:C3H1-type domain-containing protein n=1 Tax=Sphenostylis stenocarpa TaxID=92480 RepID=A0AA86SI70_9FABA|nr:unnamed protein product [Sphenostylis stenocarpa]